MIYDKAKEDKRNNSSYSDSNQPFYKPNGNLLTAFGQSPPQYLYTSIKVMFWKKKKKKSKVKI